MNKTSTIDFVEAFYVYKLFAFAYRELEVRIVAVSRAGRKLSAYAPLGAAVDFEIGKSLGAKAKNYKVMDLQTGKMYSKLEGSKVQDTQVFAGKGSKVEYRKAYKYAEKYGYKIHTR